MKNIYKALCFVILATILVACPKDDTLTVVEVRDRQEVYLEDITEIETYLQENYITINGDDATISKIDAGQTSIWDQYSQDGGVTFPYSISVKNDSRSSIKTDGLFDDPVDYKLYYIKLNEGGGVKPATIDSTFTAYRGWNLSNVTFDQNNQGVWSSFPESSLSFISGFRQIVSTIKTAASSSVSGNGSVIQNDFGNVIVFIPSGLAYFNASRTNIAQYSPICFQIKLFAYKQRDHDYDKVLSKYEDLDLDGNFFNDDSDGDLIPDFFDIDDDGDSLLTKNENTYDALGKVIMPFADCNLNGIPNYLDPIRCQ